MAQNLNAFYKLLETEVPTNKTSELKETSDTVKTSLSEACALAMKQLIPGKQLVLMTDAGFRNVGFSLIIDDNPDAKIQSKRKTYAPVALGAKYFSPRNSRCPYYLRKFWQFTCFFLSLHTFCAK